MPEIAYISELADHGLSRETIATLQSHGIASIPDLMVRMQDGEMKQILDEDERFNLIAVLWRWIGRPLGIELKPTD